MLDAACAMVNSQIFGYLSDERVTRTALVQPASGSPPALTSIDSLIQDLRRADRKVRGWIEDPSVLEDDDINPPSEAILTGALKLAKFLITDAFGSRNPFQEKFVGVSIGSGGKVSFEFQSESGQRAMVYVVNDDKAVDQIFFVDNSVIGRFKKTIC